MKNVITAFLALAVIAVGLFIARDHQLTDGIKAAHQAELNGDYKTALSNYVNTLEKAVPSLVAPDINRSKALPAAAWKKEMAAYAAWPDEPTPKWFDPAKRRLLLDAILRTAPRVDTENFLSSASVKGLSLEQYHALWDSSFFANLVPIDPNQAPLASACFNRNISIIAFCAPTSYTYEVSLVDTVSNHRTQFLVYPESCTRVLAAPGTYVLFCKSSFCPEPGKIWRSSPSIVPLIVPSKTSLVSLTFETQVKRDKK
jgi:hypothetical protein